VEPVEDWGLKAMPKEKDDNGIVWQYRNCPIRFIPKSIEAFWQIKKYYADFPSAPFPTIKEVSLRFLQASNYYEKKLIEFKGLVDG